MNFFELPDPVFLKIFRYLPFEDRVRSGRVDSAAFRRMSKIAISETKVLNINEYVQRRGNNFTPLALSALMELCADNLQKIHFTCWSGVDDDDEERKLARVNALLDVFGQFYCPNLTSFQCKMALGGTETMMLRTVLTNSPNLESLSVGNISFPDTITSEKLVSLECDCTEDGIRSLTGRVPNLKSFIADVKFKSPASMLLDRFLATVPNLEELSLRMYDYGLNLEDSNDSDDSMDSEDSMEAMESFWQLKRLVLLEVVDRLAGISPAEPSNIGDNALIKMAESFPVLRYLHVPSDEITGRGVAALSSLPDLQELTLQDNYQRRRDEEADDWSAEVVRELSKCGSLRSIQLCGCWAALSLPSLGLLCFSCPQLSRVSCLDLTWLESEEQAAAMVYECFEAVGDRRILFTFEAAEPELVRNADIWRSKPMQDALRKLKEEQELELECDWVNF